MKTLKFSKDSWHFWVAHRFGPLDYFSEVTDFCTYVRQVVMGIMGFVLVCLIALGLTYALGCTVGWAIACVKYWQLIEPGIAVRFMLFALGLIASCSLCLGAILGYVEVSRRLHVSKEKRLANTPDEKPGFMIHAYQSFKDKTCFRVELE